MHIEKNICDKILGILLNIDEKTKDTPNAHKDLANLELRKELHLHHDGRRCIMTIGTYMLDVNEKRNFVSGWQMRNFLMSLPQIFQDVLRCMMERYLE